MKLIPHVRIEKATLFTIIVLLMCIAGSGIAWKTTLKTSHTVTRTTEGFSPKKLLIRKGDAVTFINATGKSIRPSSDTDVLRDHYPEFDPTNDIGPGESWTFSFEKAGIWSYHDRLDAERTGTVLVQGSFGESVRNCIGTGDKNIRAQCWDAEMRTIIEKRGLSAALAQFAEWYESDAEFRKNCHDVTHELGKAAYRRFLIDGKTVDMPQVAYCGYGFYHGFMEEMVATNGISSFAKSGDYCKAIYRSGAFPSERITQGAAWACYHGMGHAMYDSMPRGALKSDQEVLHAVLDLCDQISVNDPQARLYCGFGASNALAIDYYPRFDKAGYDERDLPSVCGSLKPPYRFTCFSETGMEYAYMNTLSRQSARAYTHDLKVSGDIAGTLYGFLYGTARLDIDHPDYALFHDICTESTDEYVRTNCLRGVLDSYRNDAALGDEAKRMFGFCGAYETGTREHEYCVYRTSLTLRTTYTDAAMTTYCDALPKEDIANCLRALKSEEF